MQHNQMPAHLRINQALDVIEAETDATTRTKKITALLEDIMDLPCYTDFIDQNVAMIKMTGKYAPLYADAHANDYKDVEPDKLTPVRNLYGYWMERVNEYLLLAVDFVAEASKAHGYASFEDFRDGFVPVVVRMGNVFSANQTPDRDLETYRLMRRQTAFINEIGERALTIADADFANPAKVAEAFRGIFDDPMPVPQVNPLRRPPPAPKNS